MTNNLPKAGPPTKEKAGEAPAPDLDEAALRQLTFKPGATKRIALAIIESFLADFIQWSDDIELPEIKAKDRNCIGMAWRRLREIGLIERMQQFRGSKVKSRRGATVFQYRLTSLALAKTFLTRNGWTRTRRGQPELPFDAAPTQ